MNQDLTEKLTDRSIWNRLLYMLLFSVLYGVGKFVLFAVVVFQFFHNLAAGESNPQLLTFGRHLSTYLYQIMLFMTFNSEQHPYPLGPWPDDQDASG